MHKAAPQCLKPPQGVGCGLHHGPPNTGHLSISRPDGYVGSAMHKSTAKYPVLFL